MPDSSPLWSAPGLIRREPLLFIRGGPAQPLVASLLFTPTRLIRMMHPRGQELLTASFQIKGRKLEAISEVGIPSLAGEDLYRDELVAATDHLPSHTLRHPHFCEGHYFHDLQVLVDYETTDEWDGPVPEIVPTAIPRFRVHGGRVVLIGDSISEGANASALTGVAPFQSPYIDLFARNFTEMTNLPVEICNLSQGGKTSAWGLSQSDTAIAAQPDLVIIAFGMNDPFDGITPAEFSHNIATLMDRIKARLPDVEFVLVAGMSPNPEWHMAMKDIREQIFKNLKLLSATGVAFCDVRSTWDEVERRKGFWSITGNGLNHPNDYGHKLYADCLLAVCRGEF